MVKHHPYIEKCSLIQCLNIQGIIQVPKQQSNAILDPQNYQAWPSGAAGALGQASPWRSLSYLGRSEVE